MILKLARMRGVQIIHDQINVIKKNRKGKRTLLFIIEILFIVKH
jgi:hypothetical protein